MMMSKNIYLYQIEQERDQYKQALTKIQSMLMVPNLPPSEKMVAMHNIARDALTHSKEPELAGIR
jgi:hypothetical protein